MFVSKWFPLRHQQILIKLSIQHPIKVKKQVLIHSTKKKTTPAILWQRRVLMMIILEKTYTMGSGQ